ncbi:MAG: tyrosine-type recombinase/integrase [Thermoanaerobaculia bacterium]
MAKLKLVQPEKSAKFQPPRRKANSETRSREYLTVPEVRKLRDGARSTGRNPHRDGLLVLMLFRHGLRVTEEASLTWDDIHFDDGTMFVRRAKNGRESRHFMEGDEIRELKKLKRESASSRFVFCSERGGPLSNRSIHHIVKKAGEEAGLPFPVHPHMLRHAKGYQLAQNGADTRAIQGYLGHRDIKSTVIYTELDPNRFKGFGKDL